MMKNIKKIFASLLLAALFAAALCSCSPDIPEGQGLLVVETNCDNLYLKSVYAKKAGEFSYRRVWSEHHGINMTHGNIFLDAGFYKIYAVTAYWGIIPSIHTTGFAEIQIREGETKFLYADGVFLSE